MRYERCSGEHGLKRDAKLLEIGTSSVNHRGVGCKSTKDLTSREARKQSCELRN